MDDDGVVVFDVYKQQLIDAAGRSSQSIEAVGGDSQKLKHYLQCSISEYAKMAHVNLAIAQKLGKKTFSPNQLMTMALNDFEKSPKSRMIEKTAGSAITNIRKNECRFLGTAGQVQCGSVTIDLGQNTIKYGNAILSPGADKFFGVTATFRVSLSDSVSRANESADEFSKSHGKDVSLSSNKSTNLSSTNKQALNIAPFLPR